MEDSRNAAPRLRLMHASSSTAKHLSLVTCHHVFSEPTVLAHSRSECRGGRQGAGVARGKRERRSRKWLTKQPLRASAFPKLSAWALMNTQRLETPSAECPPELPSRTRLPA